MSPGLASRPLGISAQGETLPSAPAAGAGTSVTPGVAEAVGVPEIDGVADPVGVAVAVAELVGVAEAVTVGVELAVTTGVADAAGVEVDVLGVVAALGASLATGVVAAVASTIARARTAPLRLLTEGVALASAVAALDAVEADAVGVDDVDEFALEVALGDDVGEALDVGRVVVVAAGVDVALALASGVALTDAAGVAAIRTATFGSQIGSVGSVFAGCC